MLIFVSILQLDCSNHHHLEAILTITKSPGTLVLEKRHFHNEATTRDYCLQFGVADNDLVWTDEPTK